MSVDIEFKYPELNREQIREIVSLNDCDRCRHIDLTIANIIAGNIRKSMRNLCSRKTVSQKIREEVAIKCHLTCQECGWQNGNGNDKEMHIDHVIPLSRGGTNTIDNYQLLCVDCNLKKGGRLN